MPSPIETELRIQDSPVPTQIVFGLEGSIVIAPIDWTGCLSKTGLKVVPPSNDFQTPPLAAPTKRVVFPPSFSAATAAIRPLIVAEPMLRAPSPERTPESKTGERSADGVGGAAAEDGSRVPSAARITRPIGVPGVGKRKIASSASTFTSARSIVIRAVRGSPFRPASIEKGIQMPSTC